MLLVTVRRVYGWWGRLTALEAVVADIEQTGGDVIVQGGDLVGGCARASEVIDRIRELGWPGVYGNTDEMLWRPARVAETLQAPRLRRIRDLLVGHTIPATVRSPLPLRVNDQTC